VNITYDGPFRLIESYGLSGPQNMAIDEALGAHSPGGAPVLRLYSFVPPTVSLGRFQSAETVDREAITADGLDMVRRPTGGQAVLHDAELTYSVAIARDHVDRFFKREVYRLISRVLVQALSQLGIPATFSDVRTGPARHPNCFATVGEYEVVSNRGRKLIGSAQITRREGCVQHGSIPLDGTFRRIERYIRGALPPTGPVPASVGEELGRRVSLHELADVVKEAFAREVGLVPSTLSKKEEKSAEDLCRKKYATDEWTLKY
jgi:lipoate-protein ligase A